MSKKIVWYAAGGGIARRGPFETQLDAFDSMRLAEIKISWYGELKYTFPFPRDIVVWPEELDDE